ncbi:hypothetical protein [Rhizobium sp. NFR03]|uniref:hypothetical protein n=1 Tax=Rhizobium sp. NFR03 TaxID=1566263 RepID=UPI0008CB46C2|nr:hypothetical protein [Rhizobium sp. NFR03]SES47255.1 hypothetical protein SAMN03159406_04959 [Rhizobium sp. NFR03]
MATQLLATGSTAANSADVVVASGSSLTVALKGVDERALVFIYLKDDAGGYQRVGSLSGAKSATCITAPGTYRFSREIGGTCGVFSA